MAVALFTHRWGRKKHLWPKLTANIWVGDGFVQFNNNARCRLGVGMYRHLRLKEHHNRWMKKASAAEARLSTLWVMYGLFPESLRVIQIACIEAVTLYGSELWWDPRNVGRRDDLQLLPNRQATSILGALPTQPQGALMREAGNTPTPVIWDSRQEWFTARLANVCSDMLMVLHQNPSSGVPICRIDMKDPEHGRITEVMKGTALGEASLDGTIILDDNTAAKSAVQHRVREKEAKIGVRVWMWWTAGLDSDNGQMGDAAVCK